MSDTAVVMTIKLSEATEALLSVDNQTEDNKQINSIVLATTVSQQFQTHTNVLPIEHLPTETEHCRHMTSPIEQQLSVGALEINAANRKRMQL